MSDNTRVIRRSRLRTARTVAATVVTAGLALAAVTYGSSLSSAAAQSTNTNTQQALAYSRCMRAHSVRRFPDPNSSGVIPKVSLQQLGVSRSQFQAAERACERLLPNSGESSQAWDQQLMNALWKFARCVRANGVPNWPDPVAESDPGEPGTPGFPRNLNGINTSSPQVKNAMHKCQYLLAGFGYASGGYP